VLMAREGADITIVYLPEEQADAEDTKRMVEAEQRTCHLYAGDLMANENCRQAVKSHVQK
jgi:NAD(P)-dependent dehydrogenase (short-subunit alcohol dehydrogenase family)